MNGRGDSTMTMFQGYAHMAISSHFDWWRTDPHDELASDGAYCVAEPGRTYVLYLPRGGHSTLRLEPGRYRVTWMRAATGESRALPPADGGSWTSPQVPAGEDWAALLQRMP